MLRRPRRAIALGALLGMCVGTSLAAQGIVLRHESDLDHLLVATAADFDKGLFARALESLQHAQEQVWGQGRLVHSAPGGPRGEQVLVPFTRAAVELLVRYAERQAGDGGPTLLASARARQDEGAGAAFRRALALRDPARLQRVHELYPLSSVACAAALVAGDLYLEAGRVHAAAIQWSTPACALGTPDQQRVLAQRWLMVAVLTSDPALYDTWVAQLDTEARALARPAQRPLSILPSLPFLDGELAWRSAAPFYPRAGLFEQLPPYLQEPCVSERWFAFTGLESVQMLDRRQTGKLLPELPLPRPRRPLNEERYVVDQDFRETQRNLRLRPVYDAATDLLVTSYVHTASHHRSYQGYTIEEIIPRRALRAFVVGPRRPLWDSAEARSGPLADLSFNSTPVIDGGRVYALGWRQAGLVESYLACFELASGDLLWLCPLLGNQIDLTMFGAIRSEPLMGGLVLADGVLYACTNLGACAAVQAHDGEVCWISRYPTLPIPAPTPYQSRRQRSELWRPGVPIVTTDHFIVAPLDSGELLAFDRQGGQRVLSTPAPRSGDAYLVGVHGDFLVLSNREHLQLVPTRDITARRLEVPVESEVLALPALVAEGVVYATATGLHFQSLPGNQRARLLCAFGEAPPPGRGGRPRAQEPRDGTVTVLSDGVLVTNSHRVYCYRARPVPEPAVPR